VTHGFPKGSQVRSGRTRRTSKGGARERQQNNGIRVSHHSSTAGMQSSLPRSVHVPFPSTPLNGWGRQDGYPCTLNAARHGISDSAQPTPSLRIVGHPLSHLRLHFRCCALFSLDALLVNSLHASFRTLDCRFRPQFQSLKLRFPVIPHSSVGVQIVSQQCRQQAHHSCFSSPTT
jgi:hypothetical protein